MFNERPREELLKLREKYAPKEDTLLLSFGSPSRDKNYIFMINLLAKMKDLGKKVHLILAGNIEKDQKVFTSIKREISARKLENLITITGKINDGDVSALFQISDFFIAHQKKGITTGSGTIIAAMAHGIPIIANKMPNIDEIFRNDENVFLVEMNLPVKAAENVNVIVSDSGKCRQVGTNGKIIFEEELSWPRIADKFEDSL